MKGHANEKWMRLFQLCNQLHLSLDDVGIRWDGADGEMIRELLHCGLSSADIAKMRGTGPNRAVTGVTEEENDKWFELIDTCCELHIPVEQIIYWRNYKGCSRSSRRAVIFKLREYGLRVSEIALVCNVTPRAVWKALGIRRKAAKKRMADTI